MDKVIEIFIAIIQSMPLVVIFVAVVFYKDIKRLLSVLTISSLSIAGFDLEVDNKTVKEMVRFLTEAMNRSVTGNEWNVFSRIVSSDLDKNKNTVSQILGWKFNRDAESGIAKDSTTRENLKMLRALRGFGLIIQQKPKERWNDDTTIVVTKFGRYVADHPELKELIKHFAAYDSQLSPNL